MPCEFLFSSSTVPNGGQGWDMVYFSVKLLKPHQNKCVYLDKKDF
jgi:hypothetical protein